LEHDQTRVAGSPDQRWDDTAEDQLARQRRFVADEGARTAEGGLETVAAHASDVGHVHQHPVRVLGDHAHELDEVQAARQAGGLRGGVLQGRVSLVVSDGHDDRARILVAHGGPPRLVAGVVEPSLGP
jgi:hypothetical protein